MAQPGDVLDSLCGLMVRCAAEIGIHEYLDPRRVLGL